jgi:nucleotide-binding universal stress UspA family protein
MFHDILISYDGSPHADRALDEAIDLAQLAHARLTILTAITRAPAWAYSGPSVAAAATLSSELEHEAQKIQCRGVDRVPDDLPITKILTHEPIIKALMKQIRDGNHDLVVMGSRGFGPVRGTLLGSVSQHVLSHSSVPVLIVHANPDAVPDPPEPVPTAEAV